MSQDRQDRPSLGLEISATSGADTTLADLLWRVRESYCVFAGRSSQINPGGRWIRETNRVTRKEWTGYDRTVILETELALGSGWRVHVENPDGSIQHPIPYRDVCTTERDELKRRECVEIHAVESVSDVPPLKRHDAFRAAETLMTGLAMDSAERVGDLETIRYAHGGGDE